MVEQFIREGRCSILNELLKKYPSVLRSYCKIKCTIFMDELFDFLDDIVSHHRWPEMFRNVLH